MTLPENDPAEAAKQLAEIQTMLKHLQEKEARGETLTEDELQYWWIHRFYNE